jgi:hypothetical protein
MITGLFRASKQGSPAGALPTVSGDAQRFATPPASGLRVTWLGHSTLLLEIDGLRVLTDPVWFLHRKKCYYGTLYNLRQRLSQLIRRHQRRPATHLRQFRMCDPGPGAYVRALRLPDYRTRSRGGGNDLLLCALRQRGWRAGASGRRLKGQTSY